MCSLQRPMDSKNQIRIVLEAEAVLLLKSLKTYIVSPIELSEKIEK